MELTKELEKMQSTFLKKLIDCYVNQCDETSGDEISAPCCECASQKRQTKKKPKRKNRSCKEDRRCKCRLAGRACVNCLDFDNCCNTPDKLRERKEKEEKTKANNNTRKSGVKRKASEGQANPSVDNLPNPNCPPKKSKESDHKENDKGSVNNENPSQGDIGDQQAKPTDPSPDNQLAPSTPKHPVFTDFH